MELQSSKLLGRFEKSRENHMGYPYNLAFSSELASRFSGYLINNLGDPFVGSHYGTEVCDVEIEVVEWAKSVWGASATGDYWGSVVASGTEGNLWAIYLGREALVNPVLFCSADAHYSIPKAAKILGLECVTCASNENGEILLPDFRKNVKAHADRGIIVALTCGTTIRGAHDDIEGCLEILDEEGIAPNQRYVHVDAALNGLVVPFLDDVDSEIVPTFQMDIDSISTSGHKMIGTPMPCGILVALSCHTDRVASSISYIRSNDTTLMGSRNGHAALAIWERITDLGVEGFRRESIACLERATGLANRMKQLGVPVLQNKYSLTLVFPKPNDLIVKKYQLACDGDIAHAIVMPNVDENLINRFLQDYLADFAEQSDEVPVPEPTT
ncbi:MAG: histidine decarboxylase [Litoreibacter sp.]